MPDPFIGQITLFAGNFAPRGWAFCEGQLLDVSQHQSLFSILGTTYGGDGRRTFGLPDLRGRVPIQQGAGPALSSYDLGQKGGAESVALTKQQMPKHAHAARCYNSRDGAEEQPGGHAWGPETEGKPYTSSAPDRDMSAEAIGDTGGGEPHPNVQPYLAINFIIALEGTYPSRS